MLAAVFGGIHPGVVLKGKWRSVTATGVGAAVMRDSQGRGWHCPAEWSVQAAVLEEQLSGVP